MSFCAYNLTDQKGHIYTERETINIDALLMAEEGIAAVTRESIAHMQLAKLMSC